MKREQKKNIENLEKVIEEKKKLPDDYKKKIKSRIMKNVIFMISILIYLTLLFFGMYNIPTDVFTFGLRIISIIILTIAIAFFEIGYKKDNEAIWLHGVEIMIIAIFNLYLIYLYSIFYSNFGMLLLVVGIIYLAYYALKIIIIQRHIEKEYKKSLRDIGEIVKKS